MLTVTGYGGTGKTRFSIELFRRLAPEYAGGAAFVSLASVTAAAEVLPTVGIALDIAEAHGRSALDALVHGDRRPPRAPRARQSRAGARCRRRTSRRSSRAAPSLQVIATSRAPLKIGAESEFGLPPLELPAQDATSLEALRTCPSVALLVQRAEKVKPGFALTAANAAAIAAICRRLDGLPLALELAAARVRILEPAALLQRLDHALDLLTSGDRDLPLRQRTLRATISWSYSLLDAAEQRLLRRALGVPRGLDARGDGAGLLRARTSAIARSTSSTRWSRRGSCAWSGSGERYALLETIRAFAAEQLHAGGEVDAIRHAHADYFLGFAAEVAAGIFGTTPARGHAARPRRQREHAGGHPVAHRLRARGGRGGAREGAAALRPPGLVLAHRRPAPHGARRGWTRCSRSRPIARRAAAARWRWLAAGMVSTTTGEWERSLGEWTGGYADGQAVGDERVAAEGMMGVGYCNLSLGRMDEARAALDEAIARSASGVFDFMHALSMSIKGMLLFATGNLDAGMALVEQARRIQERYDDHEGGGVALSFLAQMTFAKGDHARALALYRDALASLETVGDHPEIARVHCEMGWTALAAADARAAQRRVRAGRARIRGGRQPARDRPRAAGTRRGRGGRGPLGARRGDRGGGARAVGARRRRRRPPDGSRARRAGSRRSRRRSREARWTDSWRMRARSRRRRCWR